MDANNLVLGILAHVDAGKTTLAESILYKCGNIKKLGRVDHKDAFFDTYELERARGITIFSKQAQLVIGDKKICLLDTPGHVDFSAEMERTLCVLDYAILVINASDGVQGHTHTLWKLLKRYNVPVFLFINKMDQPENNEKKILEQIQKLLDFRCIAFKDSSKLDDEFYETVAMCDEKLMDHYLENSFIEESEIINAIAKRIIFPCYFGSALRQDGVDELLMGISMFTSYKKYRDEFSARVYKISHDERNNRLTHMKVTGGSLKVKSMICNNKGEWKEKADQIRIYSGNQYILADEAKAGEICVVTGLEKTFAGEGLGAESEVCAPILEPVLNYRIILPPECNIYEVHSKLSLLEEEEPQLHIVWNEELKELYAQVMGEVQIEVLKYLIKNRFGIDVEFGTGNIVYKETIKKPVVGIGHFEPLKHYAEVHLLLEPLEKGTGIELAAECSEDVLDKNWQRLILTHLGEKKHRGVLTGAEITDMKITLVAGRAHLKHTEGGDFRQATYRALRQGLMQAESVLLEPYYEFKLEIPTDFTGRAMSDLQQRNGKFKLPEINGDTAVIVGNAPVACLRDYQTEVMSYTHGKGSFFCTFTGYDICHNADDVINNKAYNPAEDIDNPAGSVFCAHGAGYYVDWYDVPRYAHIECTYAKEKIGATELTKEVRTQKAFTNNNVITQEEIDAIYARTFGNVKQKRTGWKKTIKAAEDMPHTDKKTIYDHSSQKEYVIVDGYNIIFAWDELRELANVNIDSARDRLMDIMCNYQGYKKNILILVFDAYKVSGGRGSVFDYNNIHVVYTREAETADQYIEKVTHEIGRKHKVTVATSDRLEQLIVWGQGAKRLSALELKEEIDIINKEIRTHLDKNQKNYLTDNISKDMAEVFKDIKTKTENTS